MKRLIILILILFILLTACETNIEKELQEKQDEQISDDEKSNNKEDQTIIIEKERDEEFCGSSTEYTCDSDNDCIQGGCSGQVCQGKKEAPVTTICDYRECYNADNYGLECGCVENKCIWH